jgi:non-ribosomal peptide synthetase component F
LKLGFSIIAMAALFQDLGDLTFADQILFSQFGRGRNLPPLFGTVHKAFENMVDQQPNVIAVEQEGRNLTYLELEQAANGLASRLVSMGLKPRQRVCLIVQRSLQMVIAILAVLKCGCQYVPLDGQVTADSALRHIIKDTKAPFILCQEKFLKRIQQFADTSSTIFVLDSSLEEHIPSQRPNIHVNTSDGVYAIYTSGA